MRTPMPGAPASSASPGFTTGVRTATPPGKRSIGELEIALALDDNDSDVHRVLAAVNLAGGNHNKAEYHQQRAISLNPNDDLIVVQQGEL